MLNFRAVVFAGFVVAAAGLSQAAPAPKPAPTQSAEQDSKVAAELKKFSAWDDQCRAGTFDIRANWDRWPQETGWSVPEYFKLYFACVSFASSHKNGCDLFQKQKDYYRSCRERQTLPVLIQAALTGSAKKDVQAVCREMVGVLDGFSPTDCETFVSVLRGRQGVKVLCDYIRERGQADEIPNCLSALSFVEGTAARCGNHEDCVEWAQFVGALRSGQPKDCAASSFCKVQSSHDVRDCEPYLKRANKPFCDQIAQKMAQLKQMPEITRKDPSEIKRSEASRKIMEDAVEKNLESRRAAEKAVEKAKEQERLDRAESAKKALEAKKAAEQKRQEQKRFKKGQPMQEIPPDVEKRMKEIEARGPAGEKQGE